MHTDGRKAAIITGNIGCSADRGGIAGAEVQPDGSRQRGTSVTESQVAPDQSWAELAELDEADRARAMAERFREVGALPEEERLTRLEEMVRAEYALDDAALRPFTLTRLRTWLTLKADDASLAQSIANGYDQVFNRLPADVAFRRATMVQGLARDGLTMDEVDQLFELIPSLIRSIPRASSDTIARQAAANQLAATQLAAAGGAVVATKPWWRFWDR